MKLYVVGAGGHGAVVAEIARARGYQIAGFADDDPMLHGQKVLEWPVIGDHFQVPDGAVVALAVGDNARRGFLLQYAMQHNWQLPLLAHPSAVISPSAVIGVGTVLMPQAVVNARSGIGAACILNTSCSVDHDCQLGDLVHIAPGVHLAGMVSVGEETLIGVGASVRPETRIGRRCVIGAGSVVVSHIPDETVAYGSPARTRLRGLARK